MKQCVIHMTTIFFFQALIIEADEFLDKPVCNNMADFNNTINICEEI